MSASAQSSTRTASRWVAAAVSVALWLVGSTLNPVTAISEGSSLEWEVEPAAAVVNTKITGEPGNPDGTEIQVVMYNGSGEQERIAGIPIVLSIASGPDCLVAQTAKGSTDVNGVATFSPKIECEGDYRLKASADDTASRNSGHIAEAISSSFGVHTSVTVCSGDDCTGTAASAGTAVQVTADSTGYIVLDLSGETLTCGSYTTTSQLADFDVTSATGWTTVVITLDESKVTRPFKQYEVCLKKPGEAAIQLPDCHKNKVTGTCVLSRTREKDGDVTVTISVEPGDPRVAL